jgi:hypothetical protein
LEGFAVAAGLRGAAGFGGAEECATRRRGAPATQRAPVAHARAMRVPPPRFASLTLSGGDGDQTSLRAEEKKTAGADARKAAARRGLGERFRARLRRGGDAPGIEFGMGQRLAPRWGRGGLWRSGRAAGAASGTRR